MDETTSNPSQIKSTLTDYEEMRKNAELTPSELRAALRAQIAGAQLSRISALPADQAHHCLPTSSSVPTSSSPTFTLTSSKLTAPHSYITTTSSTTSTLTSSNSSLTSPFSLATTLSGSVCTTSTSTTQNTEDVPNSACKNPSEKLPCWQTAKSKRKLTLSPKQNKKKGRLTDSLSKIDTLLDNVPSTSNNKFGILDDSDPTDAEITQAEELADQMETEQLVENKGKESRTQKPPPINIEDVSNVTLMETELDKVLGSSNYTYHFTRRGAARVQVEDSDAYRRLVKFLKENNAHHYSYQLKEDKAFKVIVRNLASTTTQNKINEAFTQHGHNVVRLYNPPARKVTRKVLGKDVEELIPNNFFFVELARSTNNREALNINVIGRQRVSVEIPKKNLAAILCHRCQGFGHTKNYCWRPYICGKCSQDHPTSQCKETAVENFLCINCGGIHPAWSKDCRIYKAKTDERSPKINVRKPNGKSSNMQDFVPAAMVQGNISYAEALRIKRAPQNHSFRNTSADQNKSSSATGSFVHSPQNGPWQQFPDDKSSRLEAAIETLTAKVDVLQDMFKEMQETNKFLKQMCLSLLNAKK